MRRFRKYLVAFFCALILSFIGISPIDTGPGEVEASDSYYNIHFNPTFGMYQADFYGTSKEKLDSCILDLYVNYGKGGIINLNNDILVTSHIDISDGHFAFWGNNHSLIYSGPTYISLAKDDLLKIRGNADVLFQEVTFDGKGLCYNSSDLPGSLLGLVSGNPTLTLNSCNVCNSKNYNAYDKNKPLGGGTGINAWYGVLNCSNTTFYNISGACIYESEGGNSSRNGRCNVTLNDCYSYDVSSLFTSGESVGCSHSLTINGGEYKCGGSSDYVTYCVAIDLGNSYADDIRAEIKDANILCDNGTAIINKGDMSIRNSDISANYLLGTVINRNTMRIEGSKIHDSGTGIYNGSSLEIKSGSIYNNLGFGIYNDGDVVQSGGNIHTNGGDTPEGKIGGVYQNGTYCIKAKGKIGSDNSVLLTKNHIFDVDSGYMGIDTKPTLKNYSPIVITLELKERFVGRKLVNVINSSEKTFDKYTSLFMLGFSNLKYNNDRTKFNGVKNSASIRPGSSIYNCESQSLYLSGRYYLFYDSSFDGYNKTSVKYNRAYDEFYWLENANIDFSTLKYDVISSKESVANSFVLKAFVIDKKFYSITNMHFTDREKWGSNRTCKGVFGVRFNMNFDGNGGKTLDNNTCIAKYNIDSSFSFPEYVFMHDKVYSTRNNFIDNQNVQCELNYSQQGWNIRRDATYKDVDTIKCNTRITSITNNMTGYLLSLLEENKAIIKEGLVTVEYFAVWDEYPAIDNIDIAIPIEEIDKVDEDYIISKSKTISRDREDESDVILGIEGFDKKELKRLSISEGITFNMSSTDRVGNVSYKPIIVRISSDKPINRRTVIRYFDMDNIDSIEEEGGLMENSKWLNLLK